MSRMLIAWFGKSGDKPFSFMKDVSQIVGGRWLYICIQVFSPRLG